MASLPFPTQERWKPGGNKEMSSILAGQKRPPLYEQKFRGKGKELRGLKLYTEAQINFGDLTLYVPVTYGENIL
jgi:hypothetical protein